MSRWILVVFALFTSIYHSRAQHKTIIALPFSRFQAESAFGENITRNPIGPSLKILTQPFNSKFQFGLELGVGLYSGKKYFYETKAEGFPQNFVYLYEEDGFINYWIISRYLPFKEMGVMPYAEAKLGASTFFSNIRTMEVSDIYADRFRFHDTALNIGIGIGVYFDIGKIIKGQNWTKKLLLDLSATNIVGSKVRYRNSIKDEIVSTFESGYRSSVTGSIQYSFGFALAF
jgi:hypothetical protein